MKTTHSIPAGYRQVTRHDGIFQEKVHDAYKAKVKLAEPTVCPQCGAVFHEGRWQWSKAPASAHSATCPACHRLHDHFPAGYLTLDGTFFHANRDEIMHLVHNQEKHERAPVPITPVTTPVWRMRRSRSWITCAANCVCSRAIKWWRRVADGGRWRCTWQDTTV